MGIIYPRMKRRIDTHDDELETKQDERHDEVTRRLDRLVRELEREGAVDIDREDLE